MKETIFGVVIQGAVNRNVRSVKFTRKSNHKKYTSKRRFQLQNMSTKLVVVLENEDSNPCFLI